MAQYGPIADLSKENRGSRGGSNGALVYTGKWVGGRSTDGRLTPDSSAQKRHFKEVIEAVEHVDGAMLRGLHIRRRAAADQIAKRSGMRVLPIRIAPKWRVVVGHGADDNYETGLTFSRTYGVPIWPGSALKGLAAAQARESSVPDETMRRLFGSPRPNMPDAEASRGRVVVLDALPAQPPELALDVLTPHQPDYYAQVNQAIKPVDKQPAEYNNPVPVRFLAVHGTPFKSVLIGEDSDVHAFAALLKEGLDDLGIGGKTSAGYGYCGLDLK
ncbi:type III-B CRISPR module RAMP protein Cmr6 [Saccharopolyspora flava]|nr:type III-B CRISPR module RAMP protein Cmr6 [Saccharopolyspora flava]